MHLCLCSFYSALYFFIWNQVNILYYLFSAQRNFFSISYMKGVLIFSSLILSSSGNIFILPSFPKDSFAGYKNLRNRALPLPNL